jgi:hypothetical protein
MSLPRGIELLGEDAYRLATACHPRSRLFGRFMEFDVIGDEVAGADSVKSEVVEGFHGPAGRSPRSAQKFA